MKFRGRIALSAASVLLATFWSGLPAQAAPLTGNTTLGVDAGLGIVGDGGGANLDLGVQGSFALNPPFFVAAGFNWVNQGSLSSSTSSASGSLYFLDASLNFDSSMWLPNSYFGLAIGLQWDHVNFNAAGTNTSDTSTNFIIGPRVGYDYPLSSAFTIGGEGDWFISTGNNSPNVLQIVAVLKYWF